MAKKGFLYFALGAAAAGAGLYLLQKRGGLHITIDVEPSDAAELKLDLDEDIEIVNEDVDDTVSQSEPCGEAPCVDESI